jgi:hypothetical protein
VRTRGSPGRTGENSGSPGRTGESSGGVQGVQVRTRGESRADR